MEGTCEEKYGASQRKSTTQRAKIMALERGSAHKDLIKLYYFHQNLEGGEGILKNQNGVGAKYFLLMIPTLSVFNEYSLRNFLCCS